MMIASGTSLRANALERISVELIYNPHPLILAQQAV